MKVCRITHSYLDGPRYALLEEQMAVVLVRTFQPGDEVTREDRSFKANECQLVAPVTPSKIVCIGRNYREHAAELGNKMPDEPLLFLKPPSSIIGPEQPIEIPFQSQQVEHEGELGVVIGRKARRLPADANPLDYVFGYTCVNDVTARDIQRKDVQFTRGKSFDTFCPVGPWIVTDLDAAEVNVTTRLNGEIKQNGNTRDMAFPVTTLIRYISSVMTLFPGDLIATGTPSGVSRMRHGDSVEIEVAGVGTLRNPVYDPNNK